MEDIEQVRLLVSLKGEKIWLKGEVLDAPLHPEVLREINQNPDLVEVLKRKAPPKPPQEKEPEKVEEVEEKVVVSKRQLLSRRKSK